MLLSVYGVVTLAIFTVVVQCFQEVVSSGQREMIRPFMKLLERLPEFSIEEL